jgi:hypothetical protein
VYDVRPEKPASPEELERARQANGQTSWVPVFSVLGFGAAVVLVVFSCAGIAGLFTLAALAAVVGFVTLHYVAWGWWLGNKIRQEAAKDDERQAGE